MGQYTLGRLILLVIVIGLAIGGYRYWQMHHPGGAAFSGLPGFSVNTSSGSGTTTADNGSTDSSGATDIQFLTTATKAGWVQTEIDQFNSQNQGKYHVSLKLIESRDAMHAILDGKVQPAIWSPSSPVWITRLIQVWGDRNNDQQIADLNDSTVYRNYFRSPLVILTTQAKAPYFRSVLGGAHTWDAVRDLSLGRKHTPWGTFHYSHADPLNANSGMLTMSLILTEYGQESGKSGDLEQAANSPGFVTYLSQVEHAMLQDAAARQGSTALEKAYIEDPGSRDFITTYESKALDALSQNPNLAVVYPNPTSVSDQSAAVLSAPWVSSAQHDGAVAFLKFLGTEQALRDGMHYHFRPSQSGGSLSLASQLGDNAAHGFQQSYTAIELPPYGALNEAANQWRMHVAHEGAL